MPTHIVEQGEYLAQIAEKYGFRSASTIWEHPSNQSLRKQRENPNVLLPGDSLFIPDLAPKAVSVPTTKQHVFVVRAEKLMLRLRVRDFDDQPVKDTVCELEIDGTLSKVQTNGEGRVEVEIPRSAKQGKLSIPSLEIEIPLKIGHLDPADAKSGWVGRLRNLGYLFEADDPDSISEAIEEFQCDNKLKVTGQADAATQNKLKELHGS
jgi:Putative peptidoglycan binding domain